MAESEVREETKPKGWFGTVKKIVGILFWICVIVVVVLLFVFGDAMVGTR